MERFYESFSRIFPSNSATGTLGSIDLNISLIQCTGVPLLGIIKQSLSYKIVIVLYGILVIVTMTLFYTGFELHDLVLSWGDLNNFTQNSCLSLTHVTGCIKVFNAFYRRKDIIRIIDRFRIFTKTYVISNEQIQSFYWAELENKIPLIIYGTFVICTGIFSMAIILLYPTDFAGKMFPFRAKIPDFLPPGVQLAYMPLGILFCGLQVVGIDYLNVTLINQTRFQMKILNIAFDRLATTSDINRNANFYIHKLVQHHNLILRIHKDIEDIFTFPLLLQFVISVLIFALAGFQATVQSNSSQVTIMYCYIGGIFLQLFVYCWFGNEFSVQNETLAFRGYSSTWYNFDNNFKKTLNIFMLNAQRPLYFTAGGLLNLSLVTFAGILRRSYTYIAFLRQLYADK